MIGTEGNEGNEEILGIGRTSNPSFSSFPSVQKNAGRIGFGYIWSAGRAKQSFGEVRPQTGVWEREG